MNSERILGKTGVLGRDGILTPEQEYALDQIQQSAKKNLFDYWEQMSPEDLNPEIAMATGIGKGRIIHLVIEEQIRRKPDSRILIVAGTKVVLVDQTHSALEGYQDSYDYIESEEEDELTEETALLEESYTDYSNSFMYRTGNLFDVEANVHVSTIQGIRSALNKGKIDSRDCDLLIVDEVHNIGTVKRAEIVNEFRNSGAKVCGFTATPYRHSGQMKSPEDYGFTIIQSYTLPDAQDDHILPPLMGIQIDTKDLIDEVPTNNKGQIDFKELEEILKNCPDLRPYIADRVADIIAPGYKTVIAVNFVWEAKELAMLLHDKGIKVGIAINKNAAKKEHTEEIPAVGSLERYALPEEDEESLQVIISPYVASEGFDAPFTEVLVWASPTDSPLRYTQYTGRDARRAEGKAFGIVVDCLYQTNKYRWSYNMGMWMKGHIYQLDNGLLWLGPESDVKEMSNLPQAQILGTQTDLLNIQDTRYEELLEIQEDDFLLTRRHVTSYFKGKTQDLFEEARVAIDNMKTENPGLFASRISSNGSIVEVCIDKVSLINALISNGFRLWEDIPSLKTNEIPLTQSGLSIFRGDWPTLSKKTEIVLNDLKTAYPEKFVNRVVGHGMVIAAFTDREILVGEMNKYGIKLREDSVQEVQENEFPLTVISFHKFKGGKHRIKEIRLVVDELRSIHPDQFAERTVSHQVIEVFLDESIFIQEMLARGFQLREER